MCAAMPGETYRQAFPPKPKPHISTGVPFPQACAHHVTNTYHASKVYVIVSNSISKTENFSALKDALGDKIVGVRYGIKPHTPWDDVSDIIKDVKAKGADIIVTLGAGSLTDGAKVISFALANDVAEVEDLEKLTAEAKTPNLQPCRVPIINIPTSLSGGEYSPIAGATDTKTHHKRLFKHDSMGADLIILDPKLSITTPARIWLSTGMRAVDHCVETLCSLNSKTSEEGDKFAASGLATLVPNLLKTKMDWENEDARLAEMMGVIEAMKAVATGVPMGASHGIGHQLGPLGVGHGETSCVMLPAVLKWTYQHGDEKVRSRQQKVMDVLWGEKTVAEVLRKRGLQEGKADAGDMLDAVIRELGMPRSLKDVGVGKDKVDKLATNALKDAWLPTNPVPVTEKSQVMEILQMVVDDDQNSSL